MLLEGFTGPAYQTLSTAESVDSTENYYFESREVPSADGKTAGALYGRPGCIQFQNQAQYVYQNPVLRQPIRALLEYDGNGVLNGAAFGVSGNQFWQMGPGPDVNVTIWGTVANDGKPAQIIPNSATVGQIGVISAGQLYVLSNGVFQNIPANASSFTITGTLTIDSAVILVSSTAGIFGGATISGTGIQDGSTVVSVVANTSITISATATTSGAQTLTIGPGFQGARAGAFIDGYLLVLSNVENQQQFQISAVNDMTSWNALDVALLEGQADPIVAVIVNIEYVYFLGSRRGEIWYNSGSATFPFTIETGAFLEVGTAAAASLTKTKGTVYYVGQDASGSYNLVRVTGLATQRISNYAVEAAWSGYSTISDCISYPITYNGHELLRFIFPTADKGWEYDITQSNRLGYAVWNEISFTDNNGVRHAPFERAYCFAFGYGLLGSGGADGAPGIVYQINQGTYADCVPGNFSNPTNYPNSAGTLSSGVTTTTQTVIVAALFGSTTIPSPPFYLMFGGGLPNGEIMYCTALYILPFNEATVTVTRGVGGSTPQTWATSSPFQVVSFNGFPITRVRTMRLPYNGGLRSFLDRLEFMVQSGVGNQADPGLNPVMVLQISRDGGHTWGVQIQIPMGKIGNYMIRLLANRLGYYRDGAIQVTITDPVFAALVRCEYYIRKGVG